MHSKWKRGLSTEKADKAEAEVKRFLSDPMVERLREIIESEIKRSPPDYDCPSWAHKQAHENGSNEAITKVLSLLKG